MFSFIINSAFFEQISFVNEHVILQGDISQLQKERSKQYYFLFLVFRERTPLFVVHRFTCMKVLFEDEFYSKNFLSRDAAFSLTN